MENIQISLQAMLDEKSPQKYCVAIGMNYGNPSITAGLKKLREAGAEKIIVLPLFPQYSDTSTAASFDKTLSSHSELTKINSYHNHPAYIAALAESVKIHWQHHGKSEHLLISFHGIPERFATAGDPYPTQCAETAKLLTDALALPHDQWTLCYQSQFGYDKWLKPSTQDLFIELPQRGIKSLDIICPGFAVDCLETLEEIKIRGNKSFVTAGGKSLQYIPALNTDAAHINALIAIILSGSL